MNGAEPVRWKSLRRFTEEFGSRGFRAEAHCPAYGLAEATLGVTSTPLGSGARAGEFDAEALNDRRVRPVGAEGRARTLVSCGTPMLQEVRVVDPDTAEPAPPDRAGEV